MIKRLRTFFGQYPLVTILTIVCIFHFLLFQLIFFEPDFHNHTDGGENIVSAITLYKFNTFSINLDPHPGYKREPFYPFLLSLAMHLAEVFSSNIWENYRNYHLPQINLLKIFNYLTLIATALLVFFILFKKTKRAWLAFWGFTFTLYSGCYLSSMQQFLTEVQAAFLLLIVSSPFLASFRNREPRFFFFWGLAFSSLVLTKAAFLYLIVPLSLFIFLGLNQEKVQRYKLKLVFFFVPIFILVGGWMLRTYIQVGAFEVAGRKDEFLYIRSEYNKMTNKEHLFAYVAWTPGLKKYFPNSDGWDRLINKRGNDEVLLQAYTNMHERTKELVREPHGTFSPKVSQQLVDEAIARVKEAPLGHLKMIFSFLYRSLFINDGSGLAYFGIEVPREADYDARGNILWLNLLVNIPIWIGFASLFFIYAFQRMWRSVGFFLPTSYLLGVLCLLGFSHHRYVQPLIPCLVVGSALFLDFVVARRERNQQRPQSD